MSTGQGPAWSDDWMAIADATAEPTHPELLLNHRAHPSHRAEFTDTAMAAMLGDWSAECNVDLPVPFVPAEFLECGGCGVFAADACGHRSAALCSDCNGVCRECTDRDRRGSAW